jgi:signal transduction histidine kinase
MTTKVKQTETKPITPGVDLKWRKLVLPAGVIGVALAILGASIHIASRFGVERIREQIIGRDAEVLSAVVATRLGTEGEDELSVVLEASRWKGVFGVRVFDARGRFHYGIPDRVVETDLDSEELVWMSSLTPLSRYVPARELSQLLLPAQITPESVQASVQVPVLEVLVPLRAAGDTNLLGAAQFLIEGGTIAAEFARLDRHLTRQTWLAFLAGGLVLATALGWAFYRLQHANRLLAERTEGLMHANSELARSARTSAIGAVTAHLIHGLKNPLAGLQEFVNQQGERDAESRDMDWYQAVCSTKRMQSLIEEVVRILRDEAGAAKYELTLSELEPLLQSRLAPAAEAANVSLCWRRDTEGTLVSRDANLTMLILENLILNGVQATPPGRRVTVTLLRGESGVVVEVADQGLGIAEADRAHLFQPSRSRKPGGSGLGLAISHQLARHLGAELRLVRSDSAGTTFALHLPAWELNGQLHLGRAPDLRAAGSDD